MGKKYTTDEIEVGGHMIDASMMTSLNTVVTNSANYMTTLPSHNHDGRYVREGGTSFDGVYPMVVRVSADNIYSHPNVTFTGSSSQMFVGGSIKSPIFYDSNDTGYYLNPASTSNLNSVTASQFTGPLTGTASNADLLDGIDSSGFVKALSSSSSPDYLTPSSRRVNPSTSNPTNHHYAVSTFGNNNNVTGQLATHYITGAPYTRGYNSTWSSWQKIWTDANDGSGSGLDADKLDGFNSGQNGANVVLRTAGNGYLYVNNWIHPANSTGLFYDAGVHFYETGNYMYSNTSLQAANDMRAPSFYDRDNTGYYVNPASTSNLNAVTIAGATTLSGRLNLDLATDYDSTVVTSLTTAPLQIADVNVGTTDTYLPLAHMSARYNSGYRTHMNIGLKKAPSAWGDTQTGMYVALGGNDSYPTRNWLFSYGGYIKSGVDGVHATDSFRAPIFYDSNNTGFYVNPASTSYINRLELNDDLDMRGQVGVWITSDVFGDAIGWNTNYGVYIGSNVGGTHYLRGNGTFTTGGSTYNLWHAGNFTPSNYLLTTGKAADSNLLDGIDSASFLRSDAGDSFSGTLVGSAQRMMEPNDFGKGVYGKYNSGRFQHVWGMGSSWHMSTNGTSLGNFYGIAYTHTNVGAGSQSGFSHQTLFVESGVPKTWIGRGVRTVGDLISDTAVKAPIFYDSNDTGYYVDPASTTRINALDVINKRTDFGLSSGWDAVGFGNATNLHMNGHNQFWIGAGNGTWFTGAANTKSQASGLAADATSTHDLLITTMPGTSATDRGITFAVDSNGAGTAGWRLGKFHSGTDATDSMFAVDGQIRAKGGYTDEYDYYANDYSSYYNDGQAHWSGDTAAGWHKPSIVASSAIQIQSGNLGTNTRKPQIQFHQYGYGGPAIEYDGPNKKLQIGMTGGSSANRFNTFSLKFGTNEAFVVNTDYASHNSDMRAPIFYDSNNTDYYVNPASHTKLSTLEVASTTNVGANYAYKDVYVEGDANTYYPVRIYGSGGYGFQDYSVSRRYNWNAPNTWNTSTHRGGLTFTFQWSSDTAWGGNHKAIRVTEFQETYSTMLGGITLPVTGGVMVWLRGGNALYRIHTPNGSSANVTVELNGYTAGNNTFYGTRTAPVPSEWESRWPIRGDNGSLHVTNGFVDNILTAEVSLNAPTFYDSNNTAYYTNPASISNLNNLTVGGTLTASLPYSSLTGVPALASSVHNHDDRYYTETEINAQNVNLNETLAALSGWVPGFSNSDNGSLTWDREEDALRIKSSSDSSIGAVYKAMRVKDGQTIRVTVTVKGDVPGSDGLYLRLQKHDGDLPDGKTHISHDAGGSSVFVQEDDSEVLNWYENSAISTSWVTHEKDVTITGDGYISFLLLNWTGNGVNSIWVKTPDIQIVSSPYLPLSGGTLTGGLYVGGVAEFYSNSTFDYDVNVAGTLDGYLANIDYLGLGAAPNTSGGYRLNMGGSIDMNANSIDYLSQLHFQDNVRFYDDGNDNYLNFKYGDANYGGIRVLNNAGQQKGYLYGANNEFGLLDSDGQWAVKTRTGTSPLELRCDNNPEFYVYNSYTLSPGSSRAPIFYDSDDTGYYFNPAGTSTVNRVNYINNTIPIVVKVNSAYKSWAHHISSNDDYVLAPSGTDGSENWVWNSGFNFKATGDIVANNFILRSDERLKTKITDLPCDNIDVAWKSFELKSDEGNYRTGVIAQELEKTNPEFVDTDDKGFKSVKYIDLLIAKIAELEARLEKLEK